MPYASTAANLINDANSVAAVADIHFTSISRILERGFAAPLDGLMMGIGPAGYKLFLACVDVPRFHPDTVISINFPRGVTVGTLAETLSAADEAIKLVAISRMNQMVGQNVIIRANRHLIEKYVKSLLDRLAASRCLAPTVHARTAPHYAV